jgi:tripartite-type tricarboxylate transporter receptor subunit TctC
MDFRAMRVPGCLHAMLLLATVTLVSPTAFAQSYPTRPVHIIVPAAPGGMSDVITRTVGQRLTEALGQPVVVDNRVGANGIIGMEAAARAAPDGYTLVLGYTATMAINPGLYPKLPYDPVKDFAPIASTFAMPLVLVTHPSVPASNFAELVALGKAQPGQYAYGSAGGGSSGHMSMELFRTTTGANFTHVPYKGNAPAFADRLAGHVQHMLGDVPSALPQVKAGKIRAHAVTSRERIALMPDVPTVRELGLPGYEAGIVFGFLAPAGTPRDIVLRLNKEIVAIVNEPAIKERFAAQSAQAQPSSPEGYADTIAAELSKWGRVVKASGARAE